MACWEPFLKPERVHLIREKTFVTVAALGQTDEKEISRRKIVERLIWVEFAQLLLWG